jgi:hypothetical protein
MEVPMICRECHGEIPENSKFCKECGRKFDITCSECGKSVPPESKFCLECGHHLEGASELEKPTAVPDAERKQITALFCDILGYNYGGSPAQVALGPVLMAKGQMSQGPRLLEEILQHLLVCERRWAYILTECCLGNVYLQMVKGEGDLSLAIILKNLGFLIKNVPFASRKAAAHFNKAIEVAEEIGAIGLLGQAHLGLGKLHKAKKRKDKARECRLKAVDCIDRCEYAFLKWDMK